MIAQASIVIAFFTLIISAIFRGNKEQKEISKIKELPFSKIKDLVNLNDKSLIKLKGKLKAIDYTLSELTDTKCIGYTYQEMKWIYTRRGGKSKKSQWKIIKSETYTEDFYFYDQKDEIKIATAGISISTQLNEKKEKDGVVTCVENLLLPDQKEYILIGTLLKKDGLFSIGKDFSTKNDDFVLIDPKGYDIIYNTSTAYRTGCAIFLVLFFTAFIVFMTEDFWMYLINTFFKF